MNIEGVVDPSTPLPYLITGKPQLVFDIVVSHFHRVSLCLEIHVFLGRIFIHAHFVESVLGFGFITNRFGEYKRPFLGFVLLTVLVSYIP